VEQIETKANFRNQSVSKTNTIHTPPVLTIAPVGWKKWVPVLSFVTGWINCAGWVALVATAGLLASQLIIGIISLMHPVNRHSYIRTRDANAKTTIVIRP
jgi:hypothetical protein